MTLKFAEILQKILDLHITDTDAESLDIDQEALDGAALWTSNCYYDKIILDNDIFFQSLCSTNVRLSIGALPI